MAKVKPCELYRHFDKSGRLLYVGISYTAISRLVGHRSNAHWFDEIVRIEIERFQTREAAAKAELEAIKNEKPLHNLWTNTKKGPSARSPEKQAIIDRLKPLIEAAGYTIAKKASYCTYEGTWDLIRNGRDPTQHSEYVKPAVNRQA